MQSLFHFSGALYLSVLLGYTFCETCGLFLLLLLAYYRQLKCTCRTTIICSLIFLLCIHAANMPADGADIVLCVFQCPWGRFKEQRCARLRVTPLRHASPLFTLFSSELNLLAGRTACARGKKTLAFVTKQLVLANGRGEAAPTTLAHLAPQFSLWSQPLCDWLALCAPQPR